VLRRQYLEYHMVRTHSSRTLVTPVRELEPTPEKIRLPKKLKRGLALLAGKNYLRGFHVGIPSMFGQ
jgi:hypothetical protein